MLDHQFHLCSRRSHQKQAEVFIRRFSAVVAKINMNKIRGKMGNKNKNQWEFSEKKAGKKSTKI